MPVSESDVRHIASLARLGVTDERVPTLVSELNRILEHMDVLQAVDLSTFKSNNTRVPGMLLRSDDSTPTQLQRARQTFAPSMRDDFFLVPRLETHGSAGSRVNDGSGTDVSPPNHRTTNDSSATDGDEDQS
ncbi:MAG: Asp-tRNA(Asn)/Glu-tRNA(Gln) amidotransferase subunit GatC [Gemmatimonadaceae bacterium]